VVARPVAARHSFLGHVLGHWELKAVDDLDARGREDVVEGPRESAGLRRVCSRESRNEKKSRRKCVSGFAEPDEVQNNRLQLIGNRPTKSKKRALTWHLFLRRFVRAGAREGEGRREGPHIRRGGLSGGGEADGGLGGGRVVGVARREHPGREEFVGPVGAAVHQRPAGHGVEVCPRGRRGRGRRNSS
jgi:hypothetical protein